MDQKDFLRQMSDMVDFARTKDNLLTKEEIADYCSDWKLTKKQLELVYAYLAENQVKVEGYSDVSDKDKKVSAAASQREDAAEGGAEALKDSKYLHIYRKELRELPEYTNEMLMELYERLRQGEEEIVATVIEAHLQRVVTLAGKYRNRGVLLEDLIQEGNLELVNCVSMLCGNREVLDYKKTIDHAVRSRLIELVDAEIENLDGVSGILAKTNLLLEATRVLAEEYGRIATLEELAEFTRMEMEEIQMYVDLSLNKIELGKGELSNGASAE